MMRKMISLILSLVLIACACTACENDDNEPQAPTQEELMNTAFDLLQNFAFSTETYNGYEYKHEQIIGGKLTNSREVSLTLENATCGSLADVTTSLNPDPLGEEYITENILYLFDGDVITKNGEIESNYTVQDLTSFALFQVSSIKSKLQNVTFENNTLSFTVNGVYASTLLNNTSGVKTVEVTIAYNSQLNQIVSVLMEYERNDAYNIISVAFQ